MFRRRRATGKEPVTDIKEESWYAVGHHDQHECCDCGLTHDVAYKWERGRLFERWVRNEPATRRARKKAGT